MIITGIIQDSSCSPAPNATITFSPSSPSENPVQATADGSGYFSATLPDTSGIEWQSDKIIGSTVITTT